MTFKPLPGIEVQWLQVTPILPDTFLQYNVKRRLAGDTTWTRIAAIQSLGTTSYIDYTAGSGIAYEYTVTWTSVRSGSQFESPEGGPAAGMVTFAGSFLHDATKGSVNAAANYVELKGGSRDLEPVQPQTSTFVWGRSAPTKTYGTTRYHRGAYQLNSNDVSNPDLWTGLENLQFRQQAFGSPLCYRTGDMGDRYFCNITKLTRNDPPYEYLPKVEWDESFFLEAV